MPKEEPTDMALMAALQGGEERAMSELIRRWERRLFVFIFRYLQNEAETRDLVEESFVRVYLQRHRYDSAYPFSSWIFSVAANLCRNRRRWWSRHPSVAGKDEKFLGYDVDTAPGPREKLWQEELLNALQRAVAELPHELRTTWLLAEYEGLSYREIARVVGCSEKGVESRLYRTRQRLRKKLAAYW